MTATLTQTPDAAFGDRPVSGGVGLRLTLSAGDSGALLARPIDPATDPLHVRFLVRFVGSQGGRVVPLRGLAGVAQAFAAIIDVDAASATLVADDSTPLLTAALPTPIAWHCIELLYDATGERVELLVNGRFVGSAGLPAGAPVVDAIEFGCAFRDAGLTGTIDLDELALATGPATAQIGPVVRRPTGAFADDPARWLVIYNLDDADSRSWAATFAAQRDVPHANLLGLSMPLDETIDEAGEAAIRAAIEGYLTNLGLGAQVVGLLFGHGVPGAVQRSDGVVEPLASRLQVPDGTPEWSANPLFAASDRPTAGSIGAWRLAARIDGPTLATSNALTNRALAVASTDPQATPPGKLWLDAVTTGTGRATLQEQMIDWSRSPAAGALRLAIERTEPTDPPTDVSFASIDDDAFFWGWRGSAVPSGFFGEPGGARAFALQLDDTIATAPTLRAAGAANWARAALDAGYAATAGTTDTLSISALPAAEAFFDALRRGWTLAEAWARATPMRHARQVLIGDPFMVVPLPTAGIDVIGPIDPLAAEPVAEPLARLRDGVDCLDVPASAQPGLNEARRFIVRRIDGRALPDGADRAVTIVGVVGGFALAPALPLWPDHAGWTPQRLDGGIRVIATWPTTFAAAGVQHVELEARSRDGQSSVVASVDVDAAARRVALTTQPAGERRYRLRVIGPSGAALVTPWSAWLAPLVAAPAPLTALEL